MFFPKLIHEKVPYFYNGKTALEIFLYCEILNYPRLLDLTRFGERTNIEDMYHKAENND